MAKVLIDYGHGGLDPGSVNGNRSEAQDVLTLGRKVTEQLKRAGVTVGETRKGNETVSLYARSDQSNMGRYDYFVSIHRNSAGNRSARGVETYVWRKVASPELNLATKVQNNLVNMGWTDRGIKSAEFHVIRETYCPAILVEVGFILNQEDNRFFDEKINQTATAIATGILAQLNVSVPSQNTGGAVFHVVQKGDTLYSISKKYGTSVNQIVTWNDIKDPNKIYPGQKFKVK